MQNRNSVSSLLMNESPLCVQPSLAVALGLNEAIFLQQCHYWLNPKFNKNIIDGKHWVHNTLQQWAEQFPFWGEKTIRRVISNLENLKIIISNVTTNGFKKTKFFTIDYAVLNEHTSSKPAETLRADACGQNDQIDLPKRADGSGQYDQMEVVNMTRSYKEQRLPTENSSLSQGDIPSDPRVDAFFASKKGKRETKSISKEMVDIWNELVPEKSISGANTFLSKQLEMALLDQLEGNLESWKIVCENFKTSKFLMGEANGIRVKPDLSWLVDPKEPRVHRVFSKSHWTFDDRDVSQKTTIDFEAMEKEIDALDEPLIARQVRLFVFQSDALFYYSWLMDASVESDGTTVLINATTGFKKEKIAQEYERSVGDFLKHKYQMTLEIQHDKTKLNKTGERS